MFDPELRKKLYAVRDGEITNRTKAFRVLLEVCMELARDEMVIHKRLDELSKRTSDLEKQVN